MRTKRRKAKAHVRVHAVHVADGASVANLVREIGDAPIDVLINNAGMGGPAHSW